MSCYINQQLYLLHLQFRQIIWHICNFGTSTFVHIFSSVILTWHMKPSALSTCLHVNIIYLTVSYTTVYDKHCSIHEVIVQRVFGSGRNTLKRQCVWCFSKKAARSPQLWVSIEWRLLQERCALLGAKKRRHTERLGGNYILVFLCCGASLIQYSRTHWGGEQAISKPSHFLVLPP